MIDANLAGADLSEAQFVGTQLHGADLSGSRCIRTGFPDAQLHDADLRHACLEEADFLAACFVRTRLEGARFSSARFHNVLVASDFSGSVGLSEIDHTGPSYLATEALRQLRSQPEFLRGCGLTPWEVAAAALYDPDLSPAEIADAQAHVLSLRAGSVVQLRPVFISYSHADGHFIDAIQARLYESGINTWRDVHHSTAGPLEPQIHEAMEKSLVLVVLSAASTSSDWVEHEVERARALGKDQGRDVLLPIAIDDSWKSCDWPERLREQVVKYNILDFSAWQDPTRFSEQFNRLASGIRRWY